MKLSKAQEAVMNKAKADIDFARSHTLREWAQKTDPHITVEAVERLVRNASSYGLTEEEMRKQCEKEIVNYMNTYKKYYEDERKGIVLTNCNSRTLVKLETMGLIEIIHDSNGTTYGIDTIKVLNY